ncbi:hypothetical protein HYH03_014775 [Edaphochlamys debaryana]|uniref:Calcium-dependent protein kinase n=1 Tax=Edaphochlamys debaryana TaxID=47281 RepID=A0A835XNH7_9CHLO|nr:hypothetical protein HYH03_014775 [Edaphochlamys debaryana]|eukprot:KAG2486607.1 hypothetical protein HYH03_014775 [Edaphochlamys debaryana]
MGNICSAENEAGAGSKGTATKAVGAPTAAAAAAANGAGAATTTAAAALAAARKEMSKNRGVKFEDRYTIHRLLGKGVYAKVVDASRKGTGEHFATKIIEKTCMDRKALEKEVAVARLLEGHPATMQVYEVFEDDDSYYLVMELCKGGELFERIVKKGHFSEREAARYLRTLLSFVAHAHSRGVVHADLKPENVLLLNPVAADAADEEVVLKVVDYGCSSFCADGEILTQAYGSPMYAAPEVLQSRYDRSADIWSMGVISHVLFVGYAPFRGSSEDEIKRKVAIGKYNTDGQGWEAVSSAAKVFVAAMLQTTPAARPSAAEMLKHSWFSKAEKAKGTGANLADAVSRLRVHVRRSKFERLALVVLAGRQTGDDLDEETAALKSLFAELDEQRRGTIDIHGFTKALQRLGKVGKAVDEAEVKVLFDAADFDRTGRLNYGEFMAAMGCGQERYARHATMAARALMEELGTDADGFVTANHVIKALPAGATLEDARSMVASVATGGKGDRLGLSEIKAVIRNFNHHDDDVDAPAGGKQGRADPLEVVPEV